jgi:hypothetical protein
MVKQALAEGSPWQDIDETLRILAHMQKRECVKQALGPEVIARMEKPLAAGRKTLQEAIREDRDGETCGCTASVSDGSA